MYIWCIWFVFHLKNKALWWYIVVLVNFPFPSILFSLLVLSPFFSLSLFFVCLFFLSFLFFFVFLFNSLPFSVFLFTVNIVYLGFYFFIFSLLSFSFFLSFFLSFLRCLILSFRLYPAFFLLPSPLPLPLVCVTWSPPKLIQSSTKPDILCPNYPSFNPKRYANIWFKCSRNKLGLAVHRKCVSASWSRVPPIREYVIISIYGVMEFGYGAS